MVAVIYPQHIIPYASAVNADERRLSADVFDIEAKRQMDGVVDLRFKRNGMKSGGNPLFDICLVNARNERFAPQPPSDQIGYRHDGNVMDLRK